MKSICRGQKLWQHSQKFWSQSISFFQFFNFPMLSPFYFSWKSVFLKQGVTVSFCVSFTDMVSFYTLPSTVMHHPTHRTLKAAYSFYNVSNKTNWIDLMQDALIAAKNVSVCFFHHTIIVFFLMLSQLLLSLTHCSLVKQETCIVKVSKSCSLLLLAKLANVSKANGTERQQCL